MNGILSLDTNIFIYYFQKNEHFGKYAKYIFENLVAGKRNAITSIITFTELLSLKQPDQDITMLQQAFLQTPRLTICEVTQDIALVAARLRRTYNFRLPEAIQLATALSAKADLFITNDSKLKKCKELNVTPLRDVFKHL